jgi:hypothetical protein
LTDSRRYDFQYNSHDVSDEFAAMETALRVLTAILDRVEPGSTDIEELQRIAPDCSDFPLDRLAREVVKRIVSRLRYGPLTRAAGQS